MALVVLPALASKHLETLSHTFLSALHASRCGYDAVLVCNAANAPFVPILRLAGTPVALNVDGLERKRRKWGRLGRAYYRLCEALAAHLADGLITDAEVIRRYYRRSYRRGSRMIPYGGDLEPPQSTEILDRLGLEAGEYLLYVSRFEPENNPDRVVEAYGLSNCRRTLVMVGAAPYAPQLTARVRQLADERVMLPGAVYGDGYRQLLFNCRLYIHATEVGGTHPALVEAMGAARPVLYYDTPENREVAGGVGRRFRFTGETALQLAIDGIIEDEAELERLGRLSRRRVAESYAWSDVTSAYEEVLTELC
jgi:glycosyltransferase involved in cell wall biosynthesis